MAKHINDRQSESGNVLFLILIAVALFAALSYAVTQSTRSGGGSTERETALLNSATLTQYPTALRTAVVRLVLSGTAADGVSFDAPTDASFGGGSASIQVFHPTGGAAVFQEPPAEAIADNTLGNWSYNANFEIPGIGQTGAGGNELIAFLPGVSVGICRRLNEELGVPSNDSTDTGIPDFEVTTDTDITATHAPANSVDAFPATAVEAISNSGDDFSGQPSGCFRDSTIGDGGTPAYIYYAVLLER